MKIIIADDNRDNLYVLTLILKDHNHEIATVKNGRELIDSLKREKFDIVLMDIEMPVMNGLTALNHIRNREAGEENSGIPVIAMTAHSGRIREEYMSSGFSDILSKPIDFESLNDVIMNHFTSSNRQE